MNTAKRFLGALLTLLAASWSARAQNSLPDVRVSLRVESRQLSEVVQYLREQSGYNLVVLDGGDTPISLDVTDVSWLDALELAAELAGCVVEERTAGVLVVTRPPRVDFAFDNAEITQVIDTIAKLSGANIVIAPEVSGTLSLRLKDVPWRDALEVAVKTLGFVVVEEDRGILRVVDPLSLQAQMETHSYQLRYVRPPSRYLPVIDSEFVTLTQRVGQSSQGGAGGQIDYEKTFPLYASLKKALSPGGDLDYIPPPTNVMIVRDTAQVHAAIQEMLDRLDIEPPQVFIDVKFVSTANRDLFNLGVDYGDLGPQITYSMGQIPITLPFNLGSGGWEDLIIADPTGEGPFAVPPAVIPPTIFGALSFTQWAGALRMLQRDTTAEVIQAPKLVALDGQEATIFVGETVRYAQAKSEQGQAGGLQLSVEEADNSPVETGFQLLVQPHVIPGSNKVAMVIIPKETSLTGTGDPTIAPPGFDVFTVGASGQEGTIALPRERSSTIVTSTLLESGQTAILGGLSTDTDTETISEVPYLSEIPLLGWFFRHESRTRDRQVLWVFITPTVVRSSTDAQRLLEREVLRRQDAYSERLQQILYGGDPEFQPGHVPVEPTGEAAPAETEAEMTPGVVVGEGTEPVEEPGQWATFVQPTGDPADQEVIDEVEGTKGPEDEP
jgi:type IV pilus assembly protein PilQ